MKLEITNPQSPLHCSVMLQERRKSGVPLTPDFCREILTSSANQSVAGKLLDMIENRLSAAPQEIDAYLPYVEAMVSRTVATPKIIEKAANLVNEFFPYDNYTAEEYAFSCRFAALKKHTANSACIAQKLLKRVKNGVRGDAGTVYNPENPRFNLDAGIYSAYPERLAPDMVRMLRGFCRSGSIRPDTLSGPGIQSDTPSNPGLGIRPDTPSGSGIRPDTPSDPGIRPDTPSGLGIRPGLYDDAPSAADIFLMGEMGDLLAPCAAGLLQSNPGDIFDVVAWLGMAAAELSSPAQKDACAGCQKRILYALRNVREMPPEMLHGEKALFPLLLDAVGVRPADREFPALARQGKEIYAGVLPLMCRFHFVEAFLPRLLEQRVNVRACLQEEKYQGTPELLNVSLPELASRAGSVDEAAWLLHECFAFRVCRNTVTQWLRYPETSGARLYEDYLIAQKEGNATVSELAAAVNRGALSNFRLIALANREPFVNKPRTDLRDNGLKALLNVYCEAYARKAEPPEDVYKSIYNVRFGKSGRLEQDPRKPLELFRLAVAELGYKRQPPELAKLTRPGCGYNRLLLKKPFTR